MSKGKTFFYYLFEFLISIAFFAVIILLILTFTVLNKDFVKSEITKSDFSQTIYSEIMEEFSYYTAQSGLSDEIFNGVISEEEVGKDVDTYLSYYFDNGEKKIDTAEISERLNNNINKYLEENNISVADSGSLEMFVDKIIEIYKQGIDNSFLVPQVVFQKILKIGRIMLAISLVLTIVLAVFSKLFFKRTIMAIPFITSGLLGIFSVLYLRSKVNMDSFYFMTDAFSGFVKTVSGDVFAILIIASILTLIVGIILVIVRYYTRASRKRIAKRV